MTLNKKGAVTLSLSKGRAQRPCPLCFDKLPMTWLKNYRHVELVSTPHSLSHMLSKSLTFSVGCWNKFSMTTCRCHFTFRVQRILPTQHDPILIILWVGKEHIIRPISNSSYWRRSWAIAKDNKTLLDQCSSAFTVRQILKYHSKFYPKQAVNCALQDKILIKII
jgi:hypothetical protein